MATRSKQPRSKSSRADQTPPQQEQTQAPTAAPAAQTKPANVIRKGIYLSALIYVEGDLPAADDFIAPATNALKSVLDEALKGEHGGLSMTLKKVEVRNDVEQDDEVGEKREEEKFQF